MRSGTPKLSSLSRALALLEAVIADGGTGSIAAIARDFGVPVSTAHRHVVSLVQEGYLARPARGRHAAGPRLLRLLDQMDEKQIVANAAASVLHRLAEESGCVVQLGTLESDMVTYRIKTGEGAGGLFTRVGMQLEAYCSGIGKVLLAALPAHAREDYLAAGPFPALTAHTITQPAMLRTELALIRDQGYALDDGEIAEGLHCVAAPIRTADGRVLAAISISRTMDQTAAPSAERILALLLRAADEIEGIAAHCLPSERGGQNKLRQDI
jgi:DNA-binding IclR family transcriptional regulator